MHKPPPILTTQSLATDFIQPTDLQLSAGGCLGLHGQSGSGKTLLLRAIADLDVNMGEVLLENIPRSRFTGSQWRRQVGLLPAESHWWGDRVGEHAPHWSVELLSTLGFPEDVLNWQTGHLSSGEKQRLALVRMLANQPRVLLLDEPTANLDNANTTTVEKIIQDYLRQNLAGAIWVSHDPAQLARVAANRALMVQGKFAMEDGKTWN
ncbi:ABC transporter ATP-binding protein [Thiolapillus sp.]